MSMDLEARLCDGGWSEEQDSVPLRLRFNMLRTHTPDIANVAAVVSDQGCKSRSQGDSIDPKEDWHLNAEDGTSMKLCSSGKMLSTGIRVNTVEKEQLNNAGCLLLNPTSSDVPGSVETPSQDNLVDSNNAHLDGTKVKLEISYEFDDSLDDVVLAERRRMLLSRKLLQSSGSHMEDHGHDGELSKLSKTVLQGADIDRQEHGSVQDVLIAKNISPGMDDYDDQASKIDANETFHTINKCSSTLSDEICGAVTSEPGASHTSSELKSFSGQEINVANVVTKGNPVSSLLARVKDEPVDVGEVCNEVKNGVQDSFTSELMPVKSEPGFSEFFGDELDHLPLIDRMKLLSSRIPSLEALENIELLSKTVALDQDVGTDILESVKPISISRPRKRRKTATDSAEIALEEDAPGLLKVLMERGVSVEEIKLYGEGESEDALDDSPSEGGFAELEAVISQLFSQRQPFMKFPILRCTKGAKATYCLSCLLSLVEQTRYLRHRKWPVEWGWCRDLQSFIFVFRRHNRIVLERPEYGFATYFFELLDSIPVDWQIKHLVTAMKLTGCGRFTLIENKPLMVGEDLTEGEARVLAEFGWVPNTGLGTMLNYCDRVVHDRKQEKDSSEWRLKIGKQLINGYNGGNIVSKSLPKKLLEYQGLQSQSIQVKLEQ